ncbi:uncharacterized protein LOC134692633 [Mytilus trossulus]|uniref:uncharacterized protein LOC134692633 n=1 Tax=Mytilus trossulus TaxID=6551 RepID=UPI003005AF2A
MKLQNMERRKDVRPVLDEFWDIYDGKWPVIITDVVDKWPAINWTKRFFQQNYADEKVMVKAVVNRKPAALAVDMDTFISELDTSGPNGWTYLEDELFIVTRPELKKDIGPNVYAEENFFNLFPDEVRHWDCLMLWGSQFSRSSLHMDLYNWTATNAVLYGQKSWMIRYIDIHCYKCCIVWSKVIDGKIYGHSLLQMLYCMVKSHGCPIDAFVPDSTKYPHFDKAQYLEVTVTAGEMLIIPTGWYHQVKLFLSLLHKKILRKGKEVTEGVLKDMHQKKVLNS